MARPRKRTASNFVLFDHVTYLRSASSFSPFSSYTLRLQPIDIATHPRCHAIDPFPSTIKFPSSSHHMNHPSPLSHAGHVARGPEQAWHRSGSHQCWGGLFTVHGNFQSLVLYVSSISFFFRPPVLSIPESPLYLALSPFRTPHLLHPHRVRTHPRALDYDIVKHFLI